MWTSWISCACDHQPLQTIDLGKIRSGLTTAKNSLAWSSNVTVKGTYSRTARLIPVDTDLRVNARIN